MSRFVKITVVFMFTLSTIMLFCANFSLGLTTITKGNILLHILLPTFKA